MKKAKLKNPEMDVHIFDIDNPPDFCRPSESPGIDGEKQFIVLETCYWEDIMGDYDPDEPLSEIYLYHEDNGLLMIGPFPDGGYTLISQEAFEKFFDMV